MSEMEKLVNYEEIRELSEKINYEIKKLSEERDKLLPEDKKKFKKLELKNHPLPIEFKKPVKYLIINVNPSISEEDYNQEKSSPNDLLLTLDESKFKLDYLEIKKILDNVLIFEYFHKKPFDMIKEIDPKASLFWEDQDKWREIYKRFKEEDPLDNKIKETLSKIDEKIKTNNPENFVLFAEFFYYRHKKQNDLTNLIDKKNKIGYVNKNLRELLKKFLEKQIDYYDPKYVIITNSYVSKFFERELLDRGDVINERKISDIETFTSYKGKRLVFLSTMFSSGNIDNYSVKRLQDEIKREIEKDFKLSLSKRKDAEEN